MPVIAFTVQPIYSKWTLLSYFTGHVHFIRGVWLVFIVTMSVGIPVVNANSVDPDQMPPNAASDLGLHSLPMSL